MVLSFVCREGTNIGIGLHVACYHSTAVMADVCVCACVCACAKTGKGMYLNTAMSIKMF